MKNTQIITALAAVALTFGASTAAFAKSNLPYPYNNKAANLQAMQWYAQQQASLANPYLYNGAYGAYGTYGLNGTYGGYPYGTNYTNLNPYYGYNVPQSGYWF
jgi:hypothetical protein